LDTEPKRILYKRILELEFDLWTVTGLWQVLRMPETLIFECLWI